MVLKNTVCKGVFTHGILVDENFLPSEIFLPDPNLKIYTPQGGKINTALKAAGISDDTV